VYLETAKITLHTNSTQFTILIQGPSEKFVDSPYYSELELCGGVMTSTSLGK